jgi:hypothetical protein
MPAPSEEVLPFGFSRGWPDALPGCVITIRETGILLGELLLDDKEWRALRSTPVLALRVDAHPGLDGWTSKHPDGTESRVEFEIPLVPVVVPLEALAHSRAFSQWVMNRHGGLGRLLIWDEPRRWWMVQDTDLELVITCSPPGMLAEKSKELSWLSFGAEKGRKEVDLLRERYGVTWAN